MYLKLTEYLFMFTALILAGLILLQKLYICNLKDNMKKSVYVTYIACFLILYILLAFALFILMPVMIHKIIILFFGLSPFIIGKLVTYKKENFYSAIQIICIIINLGFVFLT